MPASDSDELPNDRSGGGRSDRLAIISGLVESRGFVSIDDLVGQLGVSRMTIHRDLDELQRQRTLRKVRGGASAFQSIQFESDYTFRTNSAVAEKRKIARLAAGLVSPGDVVILDDSTTSLEVLPLLESTASLTVITNSLPAMNEARAFEGTNLIGLGGDFVVEYQSFLGAACEASLADLFADVLFLSTSAARGTELYHQDPRVVDAKRAMMSAADRRVVLLDSSKFDHGALHRLGAVSDFTHVIVDDAVSAETLGLLEDSGATVLVAS
jgi:DeoR/GlpR family transcriptional regulator of sugar metabolism